MKISYFLSQDFLSQVKRRSSEYIWRPFAESVVYFWTFFYHHLHKRTTVDPLTKIASENDCNEMRVLFVEWSELKRSESKYIQIAGGLLFTSVTSCLQWTSIQTSHWSAPALFYCSLLFSLTSVVNGSQQILVLPGEKSTRSQTDIEQEKRAANVVKCRIKGHRPDGLNNSYVYALQSPIMLLTFSVATFLAGLFSVIFSPLAHSLTWDSQAKIALVFGIASIAAIMVFYTTSVLIHSLDQELPSPTPEGGRTEALSS